MTYVRIIIRDTVFYKGLNTLMLVLLNAWIYACLVFLHGCITRFIITNNKLKNALIMDAYIYMLCVRAYIHVCICNYVNVKIHECLKNQCIG